MPPGYGSTHKKPLSFNTVSFLLFWTLCHSFLPYNFHALSEGFKYLGFFLKIDRYRSADWTWLLEKYERRINHWCSRWLSLGGRLVLTKAVLESQPVYWLALANLPTSIFKQIRQLIYSFLWSGCRKKKSMHLCKWQQIARPKHLGGWGLRNLIGFSRALAANSLWRALMKEGLWQRVIKTKYLPSISVVHGFAQWTLKKKEAPRPGGTFLNRSIYSCTGLRGAQGMVTLLRLGKIVFWAWVMGLYYRMS
jgi:hypothetical protein